MSTGLAIQAAVVAFALPPMIAATALLTPVGSAALMPLAAEQRIDQNAAGDQRLPAVARNRGGAFVVVWESFVPATGSTDIIARRFGADGLPQGGDFRVNTSRGNRQAFPAVAINDLGEFIVAWDSNGRDTAGLSVVAQRFAADGTPRGAEFRLNDGKRDPTTRVAVALDNAGNAVFVWPERQAELPVATTLRAATINARLYSPDGSPKAAQFAVTTTARTNLRIPLVGMAADGSFVVGWQADFTQVLPLESVGSSGQGIYARRFDATGKAQGAAFQIDGAPLIPIFGLPIGSGIGVMADRPALAVAPNGTFVIAWQRISADYSAAGVFARRYGADGTALAPEFRVGAGNLPLRAPSVAVDPASGGFTVAAAGGGVFVQSYAGNGAAIGAEQRIDTTAPDTALVPSIATDGSGGRVIVWQDFAGDGDGDGRGVVARRFAAP